MQHLTYILPLIQLALFTAFVVNICRLIINQLKSI